MYVYLTGADACSGAEYPSNYRVNRTTRPVIEKPNGRRVRFGFRNTSAFGLAYTKSIGGGGTITLNYSTVAFGTSVFKRTDFQKKKKDHIHNCTYVSLSFGIAFICPLGVYLRYPPSHRSRPVTHCGSVGEKTEFFQRCYTIHVCV